MSNQFHHALTACPSCGYEVDGATYVGDDPKYNNHAPSDGDCTVCMACGGIGIYTKGTTDIRMPTADERAILFRQRDIQRVVQGIIEMRDKTPDWPKGPRRNT
jgi:hypothetical protein